MEGGRDATWSDFWLTTIEMHDSWLHNETMSRQARRDALGSEPKGCHSTKKLGGEASHVLYSCDLQLSL